MMNFKKNLSHKTNKIFKKLAPFTSLPSTYFDFFIDFADAYTNYYQDLAII